MRDKKEKVVKVPTKVYKLKDAFRTEKRTLKKGDPIQLTKRAAEIMEGKGLI